MTSAVDLQPEQQPARWDEHVAAYEAVFEPLTNAFAAHALERLELRPGDRIVDVGAGCGGVALTAAARGADVLAIDASERMVTRIRARAGSAQADRIEAAIMDGMALALPDGCFDAAISMFGVILFPNAALGLREITRVLKPGGRAAVATWTETERYELAARLVAAIAAVRGPQPPPATLPPQLRFRDPTVFRDLLVQAGLNVDAVVRVEERWRLPSARWVADHIAFAPGMAATIGSLGSDRQAVLDVFVAALERDQGRGEVTFCAVAQIGIATKPRLGL